MVAQVHAQVGEENVAAVLIEPIQGEGGFIVPPRGFLPAVADWCAEQRRSCLIADEIQTGFCRTGDWFACEHEGVVPDLITTAKGIAGGLPLAAVTGRADIMDSVHAGGLGGTYGGNPVACAAALGAIETMRDRRPARRAREVGELFLGRLHQLAEQVRRHRRRPRTGRDDRRRAGQPAATTETPNPALTAAVNAWLPPPGRRHAHGRHLRQRAALPAAAGRPPTTCSPRALDVLEQAFVDAAPDRSAPAVPSPQPES